MPVMKNRPTGGAGPVPQKKSGEKRPANGVQTFDGRKNMAAGTTHSAVPSTLEGPAVVVKSCAC